MNKIVVAIRDCIHFHAFRYGGFGNNLYEDYVLGLKQGLCLAEIRKLFLSRAIGLNNSSFSSILNLNISSKYQPWIFPWTVQAALKRHHNEFTAFNNPDFVCHNSPDGILASHINREFSWLHRAFDAMKSGYNPEQYGYVQLMQMTHGSIRRYIVIDGNHRISALHALGVECIEAEVAKPILANSRYLKCWPGVLSGWFSRGDAFAIFERYFRDENFPLSQDAIQRLVYDVPLAI